MEHLIPWPLGSAQAKTWESPRRADFSHLAAARLAGSTTFPCPPRSMGRHRHMLDLIGLFFSAFLAATLIPFSSEAVMLTLYATSAREAWVLWAVASFANTLGAVVNWALGRWCLHWQERRWFPFSAADMDKANHWFARYGLWSLLLSWMPVIGDPITFAAGFLKVRFGVFLGLAFLAKAGRYLVVIFLAQGIFQGER